MGFQGGTLNGVTYDGTLDLSPNSVECVFIANGLTATGVNGTGAGTVNLTGTSDNIYFEGNTTFDNATINLGSASGYQRLPRKRRHQQQRLGADAGAEPVINVNTDLIHYGYTFSSTGYNHAGDGIVNEGTNQCQRRQYGSAYQSVQFHQPGHHHRRQRAARSI